MNTSDFFTYELDCEVVAGNNCSYDYYLLRGSKMYTLLLIKKPGKTNSGPVDAYIY